MFHILNRSRTTPETLVQIYNSGVTWIPLFLRSITGGVEGNSVGLGTMRVSASSSKVMTETARRRGDKTTALSDSETRFVGGVRGGSILRSSLELRTCKAGKDSH